MRAFTLIELIVAILILGILAAISVIGYGQITERAQTARATADLRQVATAVLADATLHERADLTRTDVLAVMAEASGAEVSPDLTAAAWELGSFDDVPARPGQFALGFDDRDHAVVGDGGKRAALVTASGDGKVFAVVLTSNLDTGARVVEAPAGTTPAIVLGAIPDGGSVPVFSGGDTALPPLPTPPVVPSPEPTPEPTPPASPLALAYGNTMFTPGAVNQRLAPQLEGATSQVTYSVTGPLPSGVTFDSATGALSGPATWSQSIRQVAASETQTVALTADGVLHNVAATTNPVPVVGTDLAGKKVTQVAAGLNHFVALDDAGVVYTWGVGLYGQLGTPSVPASTTPTTSPLAVATAGTPMAGKRIVSVTAGDNHTLAVDSDGVVYAWGYNFRGQLGDGTTTNQKTPIAVSTAGTPMAGKRITAVAAGDNHTLAVDADGVLYAWGYNTSRQLGDNSYTDRRKPIAVPTAGTGLQGKKVTSIEAGKETSFAVNEDGKLFGWGSNTDSRLGTGVAASGTPVPVTTVGTPLEGARVRSVSAGSRWAIALTDDGRVASWGYNGWLSLGTGNGTNQPAPTAVQTTGTALEGRNIVGGATGNGHALAWTADGYLVSWGANQQGQVGDGTTTNRSSAVGVSSFPGMAGFPFRVTVTAVEDATGRTATTGPVTFTAGY